ncbi:MAG: hypothetical protein JSW68_13745 [Burkholderiales bacterium]|nr:MAG: hypothetical protein JSW68_13745 [Burkholderiales bacterium]
MARTLIVLLLFVNLALLAIWRQWVPGIEDPREPARVQRQLRNDALRILPPGPPGAPAADPQAPGPAPPATAPGSGLGAPGRQHSA